MNGSNDNISFLDLLTVFSVMLQLSIYQNDKVSATNNDLMTELQRQDREYLEKIIEQNNKILSILSRFNDMSAD